METEVAEVADGKLVADASGLAALAGAAENLKKVLDSLKQSDSPTAENETTPATNSDAEAIAEFAKSIRRAGEAYKKTMRWLVGAVGLLGLLIFGSGPFLLGDPFSDPLEDQGFLGLAGLGCVAVGIVLVVYSATRVYEPEDASLGELQESFRQLDDPMEHVHGPRRDALERLKAILTGDEASAHLGPGCTDVQQLIAKLGALQASHLALQKNVEAATRAVEAPRTRVKALQTELNSTIAAIASARDRAIKVDEAGAVDLAAQRKDNIRRLVAQHADLTSAIAVERRLLVERERTLDAAQLRIAPVGVELETYLLHRQIVLGEAVVTEMRGTFRSARSWLIAGAIFTLLGGAVVLGKAQEEEPPARNTDQARTLLLPARLTINRAAVSAEAMPPECLDTELTARFGSTMLPKPGEGFTVTVTAPPPCVGSLVVPKDDNKRDNPLVQLVVPAPT